MSAYTSGQSNGDGAETKSTGTAATAAFDQRAHVRAGVTLWGDRGPQPLFDVFSTLVTISPEALALLGVHSSSTVRVGSNKKVQRALVPECSEQTQRHLCPVGAMSVTPRVPLDTSGFLAKLDEYLDGSLRTTDPAVLSAIHILDMDFTDVDNAISAITLARALKESGVQQKLRILISQRQMSAALAPLQLHTDASGRPVKTEAGKMQFRVCAGDPTSYAVVDNLGPHIAEEAWEAAQHNAGDIEQLGNFSVSVVQRQMKLAGLSDFVSVGKSGTFEVAGLGSNVHKLECLMYNENGSYVDLSDYKGAAREYWQSGIGNASARRERFNNICSKFPVEEGDVQGIPQLLEVLRAQPNVPIFVHCAGPMFVLSELAKHADLRARVQRIGAMFLAHDGEANLLGRNFNEGVAPRMTEELWGEDGQHIAQCFPNAQILCVTTETCKSEGLSFVP